MSEEYRELLVGCGSKRNRFIDVRGRGQWTSLTTLDNNSLHKPDIVWDLECLPLPFADDTFDEIHAYEVLEHTGRQGDYKFFFAQFSEFWRILKPGGILAGTCPMWNSPWAWGDPSHTRIIQKEQFVFLSQPEYTKQVGVTPMSDFRHIYTADFDLVMCNEIQIGLVFALQAVKPSRISI